MRGSPPLLGAARAPVIVKSEPDPPFPNCCPGLAGDVNGLGGNFESETFGDLEMKPPPPPTNGAPPPRAPDEFCPDAAVKDTTSIVDASK